MLLERLDNQFSMASRELPEPPSVTARRFYYDTVGHGSHAALLCAWKAYRARITGATGIGLSGALATRRTRGRSSGSKTSACLRGRADCRKDGAGDLARRRARRVNLP